MLLVLLFQYTCNANKPVKITENFNKKMIKLLHANKIFMHYHHDKKE